MGHTNTNRHNTKHKSIPSTQTLIINEYKILTSPKQFVVEEGKFKDFSELLAKYHYKSSKIGGGISHHLILKYDGLVYGGVVIGKMRHAKSYDEKAVELRRMVLTPQCPKTTASYFLSRIIRWLRDNTDVSTVFTFADMTVGHVGTCYKAANFNYVKTTPPTKHVLWNGQIYHPRSLTIDRPYSYRLRKAVKEGTAQVVIGKPKTLYKYDIVRKQQKKGIKNKDK